MIENIEKADPDGFRCPSMGRDNRTEKIYRCAQERGHKGVHGIFAEDKRHLDELDKPYQVWWPRID